MNNKYKTKSERVIDQSHLNIGLALAINKFRNKHGINIPIKVSAIQDGMYIQVDVTTNNFNVLNNMQIEHLKYLDMNKMIVMNPCYDGEEHLKQFNLAKEWADNIVIIHPCTQLLNDTSKSYDYRKYINDGVVDQIPISFSKFTDTNAFGDLVVEYWSRNKKCRDPRSFHKPYELMSHVHDKELYRELDEYLKDFDKGGFDIRKLNKNRLPNLWTFIPKILHIRSRLFAHSIYTNRQYTNFATNFRGNLTGEMNLIAFPNREYGEAFIKFWNSGIGYCIRALYNYDQHLHWNRMPNIDPMNIPEYLLNLSDRCEIEMKLSKEYYRKYEGNKNVDTGCAMHLDRSKKNTTGSFYTTTAEWLNICTLDDLKDPVCDPSCGVGNLLMDVIKYKCIDLKMNIDGVISDIYGTDILEESCKLCRNNLVNLAVHIGMDRAKAESIVSRNIVATDMNDWDYIRWERIKNPMDDFLL